MLTVIGNTSRDIYINSDKNRISGIGGSGFNIACAYQFSTGKNYKLITSISQNTLSHFSNVNDILSLYDEIQNQFTFDHNDELVDSIIKTQINTIHDEFLLNVSHLHFSIRTGINENLIESLINYCIKNKIAFSFDIIYSSLNFHKGIIIEYLNYPKFIFMNEREFKMLNRTPINSTLVITSSEKIVLVGSIEKTIKVPKVIDKQIVNTIGAGDSFIGGFLSIYLNSGNINKSIEKGINVAQNSLKAYGVKHLV